MIIANHFYCKTTNAKIKFFKEIDISFILDSCLFLVALPPSLYNQQGTFNFL